MSEISDHQSKPGGPRRLPVWDLPTRLFHWLLVGMGIAAYVSADFVDLTWHMRIGQGILVLVVFRILWGLVGSTTARFSSFLTWPTAAIAHLRDVADRRPDRHMGHNPAGGWMVVVLLTLVAVQAGTGLFANDDIFSEGPLASTVSKSTSDYLTGIHKTSIDILLIAVALHVVAIVAYRWLTRENLVRPMVTGSKDIPDGTTIHGPRTVHMAPLWRGGVCLAVAVGSVWWVTG